MFASFCIGHKFKNALLALIVFQGFLNLIEKYLAKEDEHSLGRVPLLKHKIASHANFVSPVKISSAKALLLINKVALKANVIFFTPKIKCVGGKIKCNHRKIK